MLRRERLTLGHACALGTLSLILSCSSSSELVIAPDHVADGGDASAASGSGGSGGMVIHVGDSSTSDSADDSSLGDGFGGPGCGNGVLDPGETCDDGDPKPGDGCDGTCHIESGWTCPTLGARCTHAEAGMSVCGNGIIEGAEQCDLATENDGQHGCLSTCTTVPGWSCPADGGTCIREAYCGDKVVESILAEQCDDGTNDGQHGCSETCQVITGWKCPPTGGDCSVDMYCGNGKVDSGEQCDDHNRRSYDGCSSTCFTEPGWSCPANGGACTRVCGNSAVDANEQCDDGNFYSGDGCSGTCQKEANYTCSTPGRPCDFTPPPPPARCGNGVIEAGEACDDGNANGGDGCSSTCQLENGWKCTAPDTACVAVQCGDGILAGTEACDDHNANNNDGCSATCTIEPNALCPAGGGACVPMVCGDKKVTGTEQCDDGVNDGKHGCSNACQILPGFICPLAGTPCVSVCGDGIVAGGEQCDEKGDVPCCTAACKLKPGFVCDPTKAPHSQPAGTYCGNGTVDGPSNPASTVYGAEQCDDGNKLPFDGCSPSCTNEPICGTANTYLSNPPTVPYQCFAHCGDGLVLPPEQCDDGNALDGDGCDHDCKVEKIPGTQNPAWTCTQDPPGTSLALPVIWRDFSPKTHPQFGIDPVSNRRLPQIPLAALQQISVGVNKYKYVPAYNTAFVSPNFGTLATQGKADWTMNGPGWVAGTEAIPALLASNAAAINDAQSTTAFAQWYKDDATVNMTFASTITLKQIAGGAFQYTCGTDAMNNFACDSAFPGNANNPKGFFPLDGMGWVASNPAQETPRNGNHNYHFTTETRYWFVYNGGERLDFFGDDDVWVFVNGQLTLDIGGIHSQTAGYFTLAGGNATSCVENNPGDGAANNCAPVPLGLVVGNVYEVAVFNAERHVSGSNFQLTLKGFNSSPSVCTPICGDGYVVGSEQCDRGAANVAPSGNLYGQCTTQCKLGPYCGDNAKQNPPETCDNGLNIDVYVPHTPAAGNCAPGCVTPIYCGDNVLQKVEGEECDEGPSNQNAYGHCQTNCKLGARCGDGAVQAGAGEQCDDGPNNGAPSSICAADCKFKCGNGTVDTGEQCDDGANNGGPASTCDKTCRFKCGNGQLEQPEQCDDGKNDGSYGTCKADCTPAPDCGDGHTDSPMEACDKGGANSAAAYGPDSCTDQCLPGGLCGDGLINGPEKCDDGKNTGLPGSCKTDCSAYVPSVKCGNGQIEPPEQCDDGTGPTGNGTATSKCDTGCRLKCGNGQIDAPETCDNGINDGSYGTCTSDCKVAGYCGDGTKNGPEQCDKGAGNVPANTAYGPNVCTRTCAFAPFCGDGRVQAQFGEECEGNDQCMNCRLTNIAR